MLEVTSQKLKRCTVVRAIGRVDSATTPDLKKAFDDSADSGQHNIVLNLSKASFMSSAGLRQLLDTQKKCRHLKRGDLVLAEVPGNLKDVFELAGLTDLFKMYETDVEAVGNF